MYNNWLILGEQKRTSSSENRRGGFIFSWRVLNSLRIHTSIMHIEDEFYSSVFMNTLHSQLWGCNFLEYLTWRKFYCSRPSDHILLSWNLKLCWRTYFREMKDLRLNLGSFAQWLLCLNSPYLVLLDFYSVRSPKFKINSLAWQGVMLPTERTRLPQLKCQWGVNPYVSEDAILIRW